jgi:nitrogen fixation NifU-like protein
MTTESQNLQNLYRQTVLEHSRQPRNFRRIEPADRSVEGHNPLCGDKITLYVNVNDDTISDIAFEGSGCAIAVTSASLMTEMISGKSLTDAEQEISRVLNIFQASGNPDESAATGNGIDSLYGVRAYPSRIKCATLAWTTLSAALNNKSTSVTTE